MKCDSDEIATDKTSTTKLIETIEKNDPELVIKLKKFIKG